MFVSSSGTVSFVFLVLVCFDFSINKVLAISMTEGEAKVQCMGLNIHCELKVED